MSLPERALAASRKPSQFSLGIAQPWREQLVFPPFWQSREIIPFARVFDAAGGHITTGPLA